VLAGWLATELQRAGVRSSSELGGALSNLVHISRDPRNMGFTFAAVDNWGRIDVLVNNAGVMPLSPLAAGKHDEWDRMVDVNIKGVLWGIGAVLPVMERQGRGQIINIGSIGALSVVPTAAVYCATKFAVRAISDGLRQEHDNIRVTCVNPGVVESELAASMGGGTELDRLHGLMNVIAAPDPRDAGAISRCPQIGKKGLHDAQRRHRVHFQRAAEASVEGQEVPSRQRTAHGCGLCVRHVSSH
jgi:NADP-dependent 3-hydroxy acid dehydrogenase YdfG